jgi:topoisomerase-4 subunit A
VAVTTSETPEVEIEVIRSKDKPKKTEIINLEELVDIKGWKALGNRLSEFKVTKVNLVQDEEAGPDGDEDHEEEVTEPDNDSQSPKKKAESPFAEQTPEPTVGEDGQVDLFREEPKPKQQAPQKPSPKQKDKAEQQSLFGEKSGAQQNSGVQKNEGEAKDQIAGSEKSGHNSTPVITKVEDQKRDDQSFNVGETVEFEL